VEHLGRLGLEHLTEHLGLLGKRTGCMLLAEGTAGSAEIQDIADVVVEGLVVH
jgi:hypothetical protein